MTNKTILTILAITTILLGTALPQEMTASQIIEKVNELMNQEYVKSTLKMTITTTSGKKRTFVYEAFSKDKGEKNLIKYLSPARVKGQSILMLNNADDIWVYFPRTNRVRKLATHAKKQKMQGSDFSYEDMGSGDAWLTDFETKRLPDEKVDGDDCYTLELLKKPETESGYSRYIMWIRKDNYCPVQIDYYDEDDPENHLKRLTMSNIILIDDIPTATKMVMLNIQDNTETIMEYESATYSEEIPDELFTERGMKK